MSTPTAARPALALLATVLVGVTACSGGAAPLTTTAPATTVPATTVPTTTTPATTTLARPTDTIDELVGAEGERIHVRCVGSGDTTVVLIAGFGGDSTNWVAVEPAIAERARVCSYDRPGTGTSDPATATATFTTEANELHALLRTVGEPGPYVLVGHSFGGAEAVAFASRFTTEVAGLVLVDASAPDWPDALCAVPDDGSTGAATVRENCDVAFSPAGNPERLDVTAAFAEASSIVSLGSLPIAVVTATERVLPAGLAAAEVTRLTEAWNQGQQGWAALSTAAHIVPVDHTGHHIELEQPAVVIDEITRLLP
jgi:pimeloyl-ACP methyl ester carboxylesterase